MLYSVPSSALVTDQLLLRATLSIRFSEKAPFPCELLKLRIPLSLACAGHVHERGAGEEGAAAFVD